MAVETLKVKIAGDAKRLKSALKVATAAVAAFGVGGALALKKLAEMSGRQEQAMIGLSRAIGGPATKEFAKFAAELQKVTTIGDEVAIDAAKIGASFGITGQKLQDTVKAAADMSAVLGTDLKSSMILLGKAAKGETGTLSRYGIIIDKNLPPAKKFEAALKAINGQFGGAAQAMAQTYLGRIEQLKNAWGDLGETVGNGITQNREVNATIVTLTQWVSNLSAFIDANKKTIDGWVTKGWVMVVNAIGTTIDVIGFLGKAFLGLKKWGNIAVAAIIHLFSDMLASIRRVMKTIRDAAAKVPGEFSKKIVESMEGAIGAISDFRLGVNDARDTFADTAADAETDGAKWGGAIDKMRALFGKFVGGVRENAKTVKIGVDEVAKGFEGVTAGIVAATEAEETFSDALKGAAFQAVQGQTTIKGGIKSVIGAVAAEAAAWAAKWAFETIPFPFSLGVAAAASAAAAGLVNSLKSFHGGGTVQSEDLVTLPGMASDEGLAMLQAGETVTPKGGGGNVTIQIAQNIPSNRTDIDRWARDELLPALIRLGFIPQVPLATFAATMR